MSLERHHPNRAVDLNLAKARDLRSAYLWGCIANIPEFIARMWRARRRDRALRRGLPANPTGKQCI
jgi:hypothetical protein